MQIDLFQDTVCPWCRIGKRHLQLALAQWDGAPVQVRYRAFFLNERIPPGGEDFRSTMQAKIGNRASLDQLFAGPRQAGARVGLHFDFDAITRTPNTLLSHRLIALAPDSAKEAVIDAIYAAYFEQGRDIGDLEVLLEVAEAAGLDRDALRDLLLSDAATEQVLADVRWAQEAGISGVPFYIVDHKYAWSGAQPPEAIVQMLKQIEAKQS
ncbi:MAG: DsbA family oxidoreductase [Anaerolineae bacterium]